MQISNNGINLIKQFEGCRLMAYQDCIGVWTIGYGWTQPIDGKVISKGMAINQQKADALLLQGVELSVNCVNDLLLVSVNQDQFDALVDFAYNLGINALKGSTLLKKINAGDYIGAANEFHKWNKAGGKELAGLTRRRGAEKSLFLS
ncbi:lysozyme [Obesumbacterium proteus]|uniref:lysozyme n=1 Tax=Obesumbacterium proteus TaxID=82983 RepID=UPI0010354D45|nr:lysozyme [Obesumbacterium proteus]MCE9886967.1 lysozyme [Obesumbacterium proteus]MCE9918386.1 lysozyme [Obesumbacterium proteus]MCE9931476.1 lysozyme [Obesumbacterium proteus]MCG2878175.1 lysozyme [Obesumbacterium proteus]TBL48108.1 lysozyme [Obesumbacterium proteus]